MLGSISKMIKSFEILIINTSLVARNSSNGKLFFLRLYFFNFQSKPYLVRFYFRCSAVTSTHNYQVKFDYIGYAIQDTAPEHDLGSATQAAIFSRIGDFVETNFLDYNQLYYQEVLMNVWYFSIIP